MRIPHHSYPRTRRDLFGSERRECRAAFRAVIRAVDEKRMAPVQRDYARRDLAEALSRDRWNR